MHCFYGFFSKILLEQMYLYFIIVKVLFLTILDHQDLKDHHQDFLL